MTKLTRRPEETQAAALLTSCFPRARSLPISREPDSKHVLLCLRTPALIVVCASERPWWFLLVVQNLSKEVAIPWWVGSVSAAHIWVWPPSLDSLSDAPASARVPGLGLTERLCFLSLGIRYSVAFLFFSERQQRLVHKEKQI